MANAGMQLSTLYRVVEWGTLRRWRGGGDPRYMIFENGVEVGRVVDIKLAERICELLNESSRG